MLPSLLHSKFCTHRKWDWQLILVLPDTHILGQLSAASNFHEILLNSPVCVGRKYLKIMLSLLKCIKKSGVPQ